MKKHFPGFNVLRERLEAAGLKGSDESNAASQVRPSPVRKANFPSVVRVSKALAGNPARDSAENLSLAPMPRLDRVAQGGRASEEVFQ